VGTVSVGNEMIRNRVPIMLLSMRGSSLGLYSWNAIRFPVSSRSNGTFLG
jgi:hypothetical protein